MDPGGRGVDRRASIGVVEALSGGSLFRAMWWFSPSRPAVKTLLDGLLMAVHI